MRATRSRKGAPTKSDPQTADPPSTTVKQLGAKVANPPHIFVLPRNASPDARIITIDQETDDKTGEASSRRFFVCPKKGFYEFTKIAAPKRACRSWLLTPDLEAQAAEEEEKEKSINVSSEDTSAESDRDGYVLSSPDFYLATPIDPLFILISVSGVLWTAEMPTRPEYLDLEDRMRTLKTQSPHLRQMLESGASGNLEKMLKDRMACCCKALTMGGGGESDNGEEEPEVLYTPDIESLAKVLLQKAKKMVDAGLPASMEDRFVAQSLITPIQSVRREESDGSVATENQDPVVEAEQPGVKSEAMSKTTTPAPAVSTSLNSTDEKIVRLLRIRTALTYMLKSYVRETLRSSLEKIYAQSSTTAIIDFQPLDQHLSHIAKLKAEAQALRSISDNVSRKRAAMDDEEMLDKQEAKKRKKEEEESKKKNMSHGIKKLMKADTSGMKKMSSFFTKMPAKEAN
ncbi:Hypothetical protein R9X50_00579800 [Acrodontium crateriforme]|uniref:Ribonuclease H2 subunit B n=1 Tax=Acrodontium crateriforme TaxID=150365 RepID=A0AAQ3M8P1_9PEZI|nr:Hypothetical protein R9X50_00579800 [Acrodontium crateriforme]